MEYQKFKMLKDNDNMTSRNYLGASALLLGYDFEKN